MHKLEKTLIKPLMPLTQTPCIAPLSPFSVLAGPNGSSSPPYVLPTTTIVATCAV